MPKVAVVIPARYASTRLPAKPLCSIAGKPLVQHVWERCARAKGIARVIVATDDQRIADVATAFGAEVAMTSTVRARPGPAHTAEFTIGGGASFTLDSGLCASAPGHPDTPC